jgi:hypothetical protein
VWTRSTTVESISCDDAKSALVIACMIRQPTSNSRQFPDEGLQAIGSTGCGLSRLWSCWRRSFMKLHTKDMLAEALREVGLDAMADKAATGYYHDYLSPLDLPEMVLVNQLLKP